MDKLGPTGTTSGIEGIDLNKLKVVVRKNIIWILGIFLIVNLAAYLTIRWTKDVYESESEMKLDIKQDATELGIKTLVEDQNLNVISGEIEQIKSKVFLNRVIDSLDINIGYYSIGKVLVDALARKDFVTDDDRPEVHLTSSICGCSLITATSAPCRKRRSPSRQKCE